MKTSVTAEHFLYFQEHHLIEFEGLLTDEQLSGLNQEIDKELAKRLEITEQILPRQSTQLLFDAGHDLWRTNEYIAKYVRQSRLAGIAADLFQDRPLRLGFDQFYPALQGETAKYLEDHPYNSLLKTTPQLTSISSIQGLVGGLMLCLAGSQAPSSEAKDPEDITIFSEIPGSGVFFRASEPIPLSLLHQRGNNRYLLIAYAHRTSVYILNHKDSHTQALRHLGYEVGDKLRDDLHPIVCR